jgi:hypothetical protein
VQPGHARLQSLVGEPMGAPRSCSFQDAGGDTLQESELSPEAAWGGADYSARFGSGSSTTLPSSK